MKEKKDVPFLKGEEHPALAAAWDNDDDSIFDELDSKLMAAAEADFAAGKGAPVVEADEVKEK